MYTLIIIKAENLFLFFIAVEQSHCCSIAVKGGFIRVSEADFWVHLNINLTPVRPHT